MRSAGAWAVAVAGLGVALTGAARVGARQQPAPAASPISFNRDIRPILANNCFYCHGPDEKHRETAFHFDSREGAFAKVGVIVPGDAANSLLIQRITNPDLTQRMPPVDSGYALTPAQIQLLRRWIDEGAKWDVHWAYEPPKRSEPPAIVRKGWVRNPIDQFILARLEREGLEPSPEADKTTLLRRVTYDLTGLPPTPVEVDAFLADSSPDAYEKRVDALLRSPRYGERMAVPWLDAARYADTHGYHIDSLRGMWPWRDWVISAFNRNLPFDQFTIEQLAGDLLPNATRDQRIASGFNRNHMINFEGGAIAEEYQVEYVIDRVEATSSTFMGLTMGCARCHSHKFDPISHKEFYQFYAFFNNVPERGLDGRTGNAAPVLALPSPDQQKRLDELDAAIKAREQALADKIVGPLQTEWEKTVPEKVPASEIDGLLAHYELDGSFSDISGRYQHGRTIRGDPTFDAGKIGRAASFDGDTEVSLGNVGAFDRADAFSLAVWVKGRGKLPMAVLQKVEDANKLQASGAPPPLARAPALEDSLSSRGPQALSYRRGYELGFDDVVLAGIQRWAARLTFSLSSDVPDHGIQIRTRERVTLGDWHHVAVTYDGSGKASGLIVHVDGKMFDSEVMRDALDGSIATDAPLQIGNKRLGKPFAGQIDDLRLYNRALTLEQIERLAIHYVPRVIISGVTGKRTTAEAAAVRDYFLTYAAPDALRSASSELKSLRTQKQDLEQTIPTAMVMSEMTPARDTFVLARGDYRNQTEKVQPGVPAMLPPPPTDAPLNRLTLAKWLVSPGHPLTSRVAVNRFWQMYFGYGIVKTQENFGVQGDPPVHPELLDWLATEFIRTGWDIRALQRLIVTSATYRQSSKMTAALIEKDPENRLLARGPRVRLPAEMIRDTALAASGLLNGEIGGPSVFPYQPKDLWEEMAFGEGFSAQSYEQSHGKDLYRRGMYTFWKRTVPPASLATFDAPDREKCTARRTMTSTPLQALVLLNDPTYVEAARGLAQRTLAEAGKDDQARIAYAFRLATARTPTIHEIAVLSELLKKQLASFRRDRQAALKLLSVGESPRDTRVDAAQLAAWTTIASVILNLDETITKQ